MAGGRWWEAEHSRNCSRAAGSTTAWLTSTTKWSPSFRWFARLTTTYRAWRLLAVTCPCAATSAWPQSRSSLTRTRILWSTTIPLFVHLPLGRDAATALAATLRPQPSLGRECDAGNRALHIGETSRYVPVCWRKSVDRWPRCIVKEAPTAAIQALGPSPGRNGERRRGLLPPRRGTASTGCRTSQRGQPVHSAFRAPQHSGVARLSTDSQNPGIRPGRLRGTHDTPLRQPR